VTARAGHSTHCHWNSPNLFVNDLMYGKGWALHEKLRRSRPERCGPGFRQSERTKSSSQAACSFKRSIFICILVAKMYMSGFFPNHWFDCFRFFFTFLVPRRQEIAGREGEGTVRGVRDLSMPRDPSPKITTRFPGFHFPGNRSRFPPRRTP